MARGSAGGGEPWWRSAVIYQVYPRSFADSDGDGVGDLPGVRDRLGHLADLGVDAVWLSPFYRSPMKDAGYDVADHCDVDPIFGTLADFDALLADAHALGLRVLVDFVPNHTSDQHEWFRESRTSRESPKRDWYVWRGQPNNWRAAFSRETAWAFDAGTGQYYLHMFLPEQPDLNWRNPAVVEAMHDVLRFWLDRGVDGFRIDVAHAPGKDPTFADDPLAAAGKPLSSYNDQPYSHEVLRGMRTVADGYDGDRVLVGEVNLRSTATVIEYYGAADELHLSFNFRLLDVGWDATGIAAVVDEIEAMTAAAGVWPTWVLSNHDVPRHRSRFGGSLGRTRAAAVMLLTLRGTPFVYQGEELALADVEVDDETRVDPGGRDGPRAPLPWEAAAPHGWPGRPWLPFAPDAATLAADAQRDDPASTLSLYRRLLVERRDSPALRVGAFEWLRRGDGDVLGWRRHTPDDERTVLVNVAAREQSVRVPGDWEVAVGTDVGLEGRPFDGRLAPESAVVLRRTEV